MAATNSSTNQYRAGIIGLSGIAAGRGAAPTHPALGAVQGASHASAYAQVPRVDVVAVCELRSDLLDSFRATWSDVWPELRVYTDYKAMLAEEQLDLLSVVTSDHLHANMVVDGVEAGIKGIFCEKPLATTLEDADRMIAACAEHGAALSVDHTRRLRGSWLQLRDLVVSEELGSLRQVVATMAGPRAMMFRNGTHLIDMICFLVGSAPEWVIAELEADHEHYGPAYAGDGGRDPATDPGVDAYVHFRNGIRSHISITKTPSGRGWGFELICERGRYFASDGVVDVWDDSGRRPLDAPTHIYEAQMAGVAELVQYLDAVGSGDGKPTPLISPATDALHTVEILLGMLRSQHEGNQKVTLPLPRN